MKRCWTENCHYCRCKNKSNSLVGATKLKQHNQSLVMPKILFAIKSTWMLLVQFSSTPALEAMPLSCHKWEKFVLKNIKDIHSLIRWLISFFYLTEQIRMWRKLRIQDISANAITRQRFQNEWQKNYCRYYDSHFYLLYKLPGVQALSSKSHDKEEITH